MLGPLAVDVAQGDIAGLLLAGDAAGFIDPMTGDGLRFAVRGARARRGCRARGPEHGWTGVHARLAAARRREFAPKWRFNRALRSLVASPAGVRAAAAGARIAPGIVRRMIAPGRIVPCWRRPGRVTSALLLHVVFVAMAIEARRAARNERAQRAAGGIEPPGDVYPIMQVGLSRGLSRDDCRRRRAWRRTRCPRWQLARWCLALAKALKWWAILSLRQAWTFRVIVVPQAPLVVSGPYRFMRHPNYVGVIGELVGVALMTGAWIAGPITTAGFVLLMVKRIQIETRALRTAQPAGPTCSGPRTAET